MNKRIYSLILAISMMGTLLVPVMAAEGSTQNQQEEIQLQLGSHVATVRGHQYALSTSPITINNLTYVPLDFLAKALDAKVEWDKNTKKVSILKGKEKTDLIIGDQVANANGYTLIPLRMMTNKFNFQVSHKKETGRISLVPQGSSATPATPVAPPLVPVAPTAPVAPTTPVPPISRPELPELEETTVTQPHLKPKITSFRAIKEEWIQGEKLEFDYDLELDGQAKIIETRWTYRKHSSINKTNGQPRALFEQGRYIVELQVRDDFGSWSLEAETEIYINDQAKSSELSYKFGSLKPGEVVDNFDGYNFNQYQPVDSFTVERKGPTLLFSNSPETVLGKGILYADKVAGDTRVLYHHRNGMKDSSLNTRLVIILENKGSQPAKVTQTKGSNGGASHDILHLGQLVTRRYFNSNLDKQMIIKPGEKKYLYDTGNMVWSDYESYSGVLEFNSSQEIMVTIAAVDRSFQLEQIDELAILARDGIHTRGTFPQADKNYSITIPEDRPSKLLLGHRSNEMDEWIEGYDALSGTAEQNKGNYGVVYALDLNSREKSGILLNPRGPSFKGVFRWENDIVHSAPSQGVFLGSGQSSVVGVIRPKSSDRLYYTLSNGSSGPVLFNFIPESLWEDYKIEEKEQE